MRGNILIVDDEAGPRESLRQILKQDHHVRTAAGGEEALAEVARDVPDLVFLDLRMPGMDGTQVMKEIKAWHPDVGVAIITAYAGVDSARLALRLGAIDYLTKPYSVTDVTRIVDKALDDRRQKHDAEVLAGQLRMLTEELVHKSSGLAPEDTGELVKAVATLRNIQTSLSDDLETVEELCKLGEATAEVSHDVNNLLTVILTSAQFLVAQAEKEGEANSAAIAHRAARILNAATDCAAIMRRIKDFVRVNINEQPTPVDINALVSAAVSLKGDAVSASGDAVEFVLRLKPTPMVEGDPVALRTMLVNIIENALDALGANGVVELTTAADEDWATVAVKDNGCGMSADVVAQATQPFFSSRKAHGTGLGLSIVDRIVKRHHGELHIDSAPGAGTALTIKLPIRIASPDTATAPQALAAGSRRGRVLLVEDEESIRDLMATVLSAEGYEVVVAQNGEEGWSLFQELRGRNGREPLLVVTDHEMPGMLGRGLAQSIKEADGSVPVLVVSGYIFEGVGPEDALLHKPFGISELVACVGRLMPAVAA